MTSTDPVIAKSTSPVSAMKQSGLHLDKGYRLLPQEINILPRNDKHGPCHCEEHEPSESDEAI